MGALRFGASCRHRASLDMRRVSGFAGLQINGFQKRLTSILETHTIGLHITYKLRGDHRMDALHEVIKKIHAQPDGPISSTFCELLRSLDSGEQFDLTKLYQLNYSDFALAMNVLKEWRLDAFRYERGVVARAAADPQVAVHAIVLEYGRLEEPSAV